ncbi:MAG: hypothetical protein GPOALKHO_001670 [Sodalis sp.]|nr:MAG: hypothetical protein GPOALKHO_001670 [Sodalis sp.]
MILIRVWRQGRKHGEIDGSHLSRKQCFITEIYQCIIGIM